jgi:nucleotide-binding universal stress UspA family protein
MFRTILIPLDNTQTDEAILAYIRPLARLVSASLVLVHVADGFAARNQEALNLQDSNEIIQDRDYLSRREKELADEGFAVSAVLEKGDPATGILAVADRVNADLIAMATHGHGVIGDLVHGSVADRLRHRCDIPILMLRSGKPTQATQR